MGHVVGTPHSWEKRCLGREVSELGEDGPADSPIGRTMYSAPTLLPLAGSSRAVEEKAGK